MSQISEVQVTPIKPIDGLVGFASLVFDNKLYLSSIGIYTRLQGGYHLAFPTKGHINIFHPINKEIATEIEDAVISKFKEVVNK